MVLGLDESDLGNDIRATAKAVGVTVQADPEPQRNRFVRSDQHSFVKVGIPALAMKVGYDANTPEAADRGKVDRRALSRAIRRSESADRPVSRRQRTWRWCAISPSASRTGPTVRSGTTPASSSGSPMAPRTRGLIALAVVAALVDAAGAVARRSSVSCGASFRTTTTRPRHSAPRCGSRAAGRMRCHRALDRGDARVLVAYDSASGAREVLADVALLTPPGATAPLAVDELRLVGRSEAGAALHEHEESLAARTPAAITGCWIARHDRSASSAEMLLKRR